MHDAVYGQPGDVVLRLAGISKSFGPLKANDDIGFELRRGEVLALLGENGAGKTTLMNILFGNYVADSGKIEVFGRTLPQGSPRAALDAGIGMVVHQHFTLADNLSVLDNIVLGTEPLWSWRSDKVAAKARARSKANPSVLGHHRTFSGGCQSGNMLPNKPPSRSEGLAVPVPFACFLR